MHHKWARHEIQEILGSFIILKASHFVCLPTGVPAGPSRGRAPSVGVMTIACGVPIGIGLIGTPLCRISAQGEEIH